MLLTIAIVLALLGIACFFFSGALFAEKIEPLPSIVTFLSGAFFVVCGIVCYASTPSMKVTEVRCYSFVEKDGVKYTATLPCP